MAACHEIGSCGGIVERVTRMGENRGIMISDMCSITRSRLMSFVWNCKQGCKDVVVATRDMPSQSLCCGSVILKLI